MSTYNFSIGNRLSQSRTFRKILRFLSVSRRALFLFVVLFCLFAAKEILPKSIQKIESFDTVTSLNSSLESEWEITASEIDPISVSKAYLSGDRSFSFETFSYKVPGMYTFREPGTDTAFLIKKFIAPKSWTTAGIAVRLGTISDRDKTYLNGTLIGQTGKFSEPLPQAYDKIRVYSIPTELIRKGAENILIIQVRGFFPGKLGIEQDKTAIGNAHSIYKDFYDTEYIKLGFLIVYSTVGFFFLFLYLRKRSSKENFYYGLFTILLVIYQFLRNQTKYDTGIDLIYLKKIEYIAVAFMMPVAYRFNRFYFKFPKLMLTNVLDAVFIGIASFYIFTNDMILHSNVNKNVVQILYLPYVGLMLYYLVKRLIERKKDALLILVAVSVVVVASTIDAMTTRNLIVFPRLLGYAFFVFIVSVATILANRYVKLNQVIEELNEDLEKKVIQRTQELNDTLTEVKHLKVQQDADYFLTSLLINPLSTNHNRSASVKTEFFTKQKKSFEFKNRTYEIGGDINISGNIKLGENRFTAFVNGDAMGKSIQGAGGALVMGTVFNSILARTANTELGSLTPELWLKRSFQELQSIFESFDGSMYISAILGLVEESTGRLLFINAEHPNAVLYRDKKASFISDELDLRKLGIPGNETWFSIQEFRLEKNDVLILGSDGRDDILLGMDGDSRILNEDETAFLKRVEEAEADLGEIGRLIENQGELTDDFTLLKISYIPVLENGSQDQDPYFRNELKSAKEFLKANEAGKAIAVLESAQKLRIADEELLWLLGKSYIKEKQFVRAENCFKRLMFIQPEHSEYLYYLSYCSKINKHFAEAVAVGERLFSLEPDHIRNLINLADLYKTLRNFKLAEELVNRAITIVPDHANALAVKKAIENAKSSATGAAPT
ncbi:stage II sporulation protein E [Leptospira yasudae]|uniref:Stage II sporulation protein E n=1 Tax=Leptospira yasudae TaxID=2202201 RepID=A0ABX9M3Q3_9LEPT|nr:stage II sporulation protein E [Leptospira yasudae]